MTQSWLNRSISICLSSSITCAKLRSAGMDPNPRALNVPQTEEYVTQEWPVDNK